MLAQLNGEVDFAGFRAQARALLARGVAPEDVHWVTSTGDGDLFGEAPSPTPAETRDLATNNPGVAVPASFIETCKSAALHSDAQRFTLLYRLLWRLQREPALRHDPLDADMLLARRMAHAVGHDIHKMRAFVRFRQVPDAQGVLHVAWFEPGHHIVEANAPWFMRRFTSMRWAILTPLRCAEWDGKQLRFRPGARRQDAPAADAGEALWLTYYQSIFNPARLKLAMMQKEMPRKYWHNLPEAQFIAPLAAQAAERSGTMIEKAPTQTRRRVVKLAREADVVLPPAGGIRTLPELDAAVQRCRNCPIGAMATQGVNGRGPMGAALMMVGEQPGDQEDLRGEPFVGPAGQLLSRAMAQAGIDRDRVFLTNAVRHFKFELRGKRRIHKSPSQAEAAACVDWLEREIELVQPQALVALGATAARSLLQRHVAVMSERGHLHTRADGRRVFVTLHPSALLRMEPHLQAEAFAQFVLDLQQACAAARQAAPS